jgi:YhcH/YjgK/YiaL family protein
MKHLILIIMVLTSIISLFACSGSKDPASWSSKKTDKWFEKGEWKNGWSILPDPSIDRKAFVISYFKNRERWDKAFAFLKNNDLSKLEVKRHDLDGDNLFVNVSEYVTKNEEDAKFEAHKKYIDLQYVVSGNELIAVAPLNTQTSVLQEYDPARDVMFLSMSKIINYKAAPDRFFLFFPNDAHRPNVKDGTNSPVKKVVVKIKVD